MCSLTTAQAIDGLGDPSSIDADVFTMTIDDKFATNPRISYLALDGSTLANAATGTFTESATTGNEDITGLSLQPGAVILFSAMIGADPPSSPVSRSRQSRPNEVVRIRVVHSGSDGTVSIDYDDADPSGDSRVKIQVPEFAKIAILFGGVLFVALIARRGAARRRGRAP